MASVIARDDKEAAKALALFLIDEGAVSILERDGERVYSVYIYSPHSPDLQTDRNQPTPLWVS